jgi:putative intracellular protease/amidase
VRHIRLLSATLFVLAMAIPAAAADTLTPAPASQAPASAPDIALPAPRTTGQISVEAALAARGDAKGFQKKPLSLDQISQLAFAVFGDPATGNRTPDSIGMYFVLDTGVYVYKPSERTLGKIANGDKRVFLAGLVSAIRAVSDAPCSIVITGKGTRSGEYIKGSTEMVIVAAGKASAALELQGLAMGLGTVTCERIGAPQVTEALGLPADETPVCVIAAGRPLTGPVVLPSSAGPAAVGTAQVKSVLLVVPQKNIVDTEYETVTSVLKKADYQTVIASVETGVYKTTTGKEVQVTVSLSAAAADIAAYDGIVFLGGPEARQYYQDPAARSLIVAAVNAKKTIGAVGTAPRILANAGILAGKKAAANSTERMAIAKEGALVSGTDVELDYGDNIEGAAVAIVTAAGGRSATPKFAQKMVEAMQEAAARASQAAKKPVSKRQQEGEKSATPQPAIEKKPTGVTTVTTIQNEPTSKKSQY